MADQTGTTSRAVAVQQALAEAPYKFDFFKALRSLECAYPDKPRFGKAVRLADDPIRLAQQPDMGFAPAALASFEPAGDGRVWRLSVLFFGLFGPNGPMPLHLTEYVRDRVRNHDDNTLMRFADLFHHRLLELFYRAWADAQPTVSFDRPDSDRFGDYIGSMFGIGLPGLRNRDSVSDLAKLHFAGHLGCQTHHAEGLGAILSHFFRVPVTIEQFVGHWLQLPEDCRTRLGDSPATGCLGVSATAGDRVWDCQSKFRIVLGPLDLTDYRRLLPGKTSFTRLVDWVKNYAGDTLIWELNLILKKDQVPPLQLGSDTQLGWNTWSTTRPHDHDVDDLVLTPLDYL